MKIEHIALWADNLELLREFYCRWFNAAASPQYHNPRKGFTSCFLTFPDGITRLELMNTPGITDTEADGLRRGYCHIAISLDSRQKVDETTAAMHREGVTVISGPRTTGDGYYESVIEDPEGNLVELTV